MCDATTYPQGTVTDGSGTPPTNQDEFDNSFSYAFGSAHAAGMNTAMADGSTQFIAYDIDRELFNRLGHRSDGEPTAGF